jgi:hypothetical protein
MVAVMISIRLPFLSQNSFCRTEFKSDYKFVLYCSRVECFVGFFAQCAKTFLKNDVEHSIMIDQRFILHQTGFRMKRSILD